MDECVVIVDDATSVTANFGITLVPTPTVTTPAVPKPAIFGLFGLGIAGIVYLLRRSRRQR